MPGVNETPWDCTLPISIGGHEFRIAADQPGVIRDGNRLWPVAIGLAQLIAARPLVGPVCALGDGLGLLGLVAAGQNLPTTILDRDVPTCELARANCVANGAAVEILAGYWADAVGTYASLVGSEIVYAPYDLPGLCQFVDRNWTREGPCLFATSSDRHETQFLDAAVSHDLIVTKSRHIFTLPNGVETFCWLWEVM